MTDAMSVVSRARLFVRWLRFQASPASPPAVGGCEAQVTFFGSEARS